MNLRGTINLTISIERETDLRYIASIESLPGVQVYGVTEGDAVRACQDLALRVLAEQIGHGDRRPVTHIAFALADADAIGVD